jgi:proteasome assembly chaperone (PAC2) family protein
MADGLTWERRPELRDPLLVAAFEGWNDAGDAASAAADWLVRHSDAAATDAFATIDSDEHMDYQSRRPRVEVAGGIASKIQWPDHRCYATSWRDRDVVVVRGIEPNVRWHSYCDAIITVARETGCNTVITLGALLGDVPHTRRLRVTGTATDPELVDTLGLTPSRYEGPTGIVGVLSDRCRAVDLASVSLWAAVPHYVATPPNPPATRALLERLATIAKVPLALEGLDQLVDLWRRQVDHAIADNDELTTYVRELEARVDAEDAEEQGVVLGDGGAITSTDDLVGQDELVGEVERFLREQGSPGEGPSGEPPGDDAP